MRFQVSSDIDPFTYSVFDTLLGEYVQHGLSLSQAQSTASELNDEEDY